MIKISRKRTPEEYYNLCKEKGYDLPVEDYVNNSTKIKHKCSKGHVYNQRPSDHLHGQGCPRCKGGVSYSSLDYYNECKSKELDLPIEDYINGSTKIKHICKQGHIYEQVPRNHLQGQGCPRCSKKHSYTPKEYCDLCKEKGYDLPVEDYINTKTKIKHKCSKGHLYEQTPSKHLSGQGCPICAFKNKGNKQRKTSKAYYNECKKRGLDLPIESYVNNKTRIKHKCPKGHIYYQAPDMHLNKNQGCPICNESHGERYIMNYLDEHNIKYIPQKKFHDLKDKTYLSYDFYLPNYNMLIEYQGQQHYSSVNYFGGEEKFNTQQLHDKLKREYAKNNGYKLLELHYSLDTQEKVNIYLNRRIK